MTDSALFACPGFFPGVITFDDGSSIILGVLQNSVYAQKLDPYGYKKWIQPVLLHDNDSSFITSTTLIQNWGGWTTDGDGGAIIFWYDHRGAYKDTFSFKYTNNAIYLQRVDKSGLVQWLQGGVLVKTPATGLKQCGIANDGKGGCVLAWTESRFGYPGASNREYVIIARYNNRGEKLWESVVDSSNTVDSFFFGSLHRAGNLVYYEYYRFGNYATSVNYLGDGASHDSIATTEYLNVSWRDSILFRLSLGGVIKMLKLGPSSDTLWITSFHLPGGCQGASLLQTFPLVPDNLGGVYFLYVCNDTIYHFDNMGIYKKLYFPGIGALGRYVYADSKSGLVTSSDIGYAQRYDSSGFPQWGSTFRYLTDIGNAYFNVYESDNNGGIINCFWTTNGGIYVLHSGRNGNAGIITQAKEIARKVPTFFLEQNYPNPFNGSTRISFSLYHASHLTLSIYDLVGRVVATLFDGELMPSTYSFNFDATGLSSGVYFYRIKTESVILSKPMLLMK